jgi:hypothetical protein
MELSDVGLSSCRISVVVLDLSHNFISSVNDGDLSWMPSIEKMDISFNQVSTLLNFLRP